MRSIWFAVYLGAELLGVVDAPSDKAACVRWRGKARVWSSNRISLDLRARVATSKEIRNTCSYCHRNIRADAKRPCAGKAKPRDTPAASG